MKVFFGLTCWFCHYNFTFKEPNPSGGQMYLLFVINDNISCLSGSFIFIILHFMPIITDLMDNIVG